MRRCTEGGHLASVRHGRRTVAHHPVCLITDAIAGFHVHVAARDGFRAGGGDGSLGDTRLCSIERHDIRVRWAVVYTLGLEEIETGGAGFHAPPLIQNSGAEWQTHILEEKPVGRTGLCRR